MVLSEQQAREIFQLKNTHGFASLHAASIFLANTHKVSPKAIRDIWKGRSWLEATFDLWDSSDRPARKVLGRPKGRKDTKPRQLKSIKAAQYSNSTSDFPTSEPLHQRSNANRLIHGADESNTVNPLDPSIEKVGIERRSSFGAMGPTLLPSFNFVRDPLHQRFDANTTQTDQRPPLHNPQMIIQSMLSNSRISSHLPHEYPFMSNPSFPSLVSSPFSPSPYLFQSAQISFLMQQLASAAPIHDLLGAFGCPPSPHLGPLYRRACNPLDIAAWSVRALEIPPGLLAPAPQRPTPTEAAHLLSTAHPFGH